MHTSQIETHRDYRGHQHIALTRYISLVDVLSISEHIERQSIYLKYSPEQTAFDTADIAKAEGTMEYSL